MALSRRNTRTTPQYFYRGESACKGPKKAEIPQKVTPRIVRHSFAVHLLEAGIDVRYVQVLIGHKNIKSTQVYNLVSRKIYQQIQNPLDALFKEEVNKKVNP
jgi:site-specific recombinase XerD